jgi:hypothetical protein
MHPVKFAPHIDVITALDAEDEIGPVNERRSSATAGRLT